MGLNLKMNPLLCSAQNCWPSIQDPTAFVMPMEYKMEWNPSPLPTAPHIVPSPQLRAPRRIPQPCTAPRPLPNPPHRVLPTALHRTPRRNPQPRTEPSPHIPAMLRRGSGEGGMDPAICSSRHVGAVGRRQLQRRRARARESAAAEGSWPLLLCRRYFVPWPLLHPSGKTRAHRYMYSHAPAYFLYHSVSALRILWKIFQCVLECSIDYCSTRMGNYKADIKGSYISSWVGSICWEPEIGTWNDSLRVESWELSIVLRFRKVKILLL